MPGELIPTETSLLVFNFGAIFQADVLLADSKLPRVQIKYRRIANQVIRICGQKGIYENCQTWVGSRLAFGREFLTFNGPVDETDPDLNHRCLQTAGDSETLYSLPSHTALAAFSLQEKVF